MGEFAWEVHVGVCILMINWSSMLLLNVDTSWKLHAVSAQAQYSFGPPFPTCIWYHRHQFSQPFLLQCSSMPAISREPTGLPRTPGNPGRPWRGWKTEESRWQEVGGQVGGRGETNDRNKEMDRDQGHISGAGVREWGVSHTAAKGYCLRSMKPRPKRGKVSSISLQPTQWFSLREA